MSKERNKPRLGRGLSSLMALSESAPSDGVPSESVSSETAAPTGQAGILPMAAADGNPSAPLPPPGLPNRSSPLSEVPVDQIRSNPYQPRRDFTEASIGDLAASLKSTGLVQPVVVREVAGGYELIAGERRLRAARMAGFVTIPAILRQVDAPTQAQMALVENIQREELNPLDRAQAYRSLLESLGLTQAELASRLGEDRSSIGHYLRLLDLTGPVRDMVRQGSLSLGHAKLLVGIADLNHQEQTARRVLEEGLSVRNLERLLSEAPPPIPPPANANHVTSGPVSPAHLRDLEQTFTRQLGMRVQIRASSVRGRGKLIIQYKNLDEFDSLKERLGVETE